MKRSKYEVLVLNPSFYMLGGGEKYMGYMLHTLETMYSDINIDILVYDFGGVSVETAEYPTIQHLNDRFALNLKKTKLKKIRIPQLGSRMREFYRMQIVYQISKSYDLFINCNFLSKQKAGASRNIYLCMFPPKPEEHNGVGLMRLWRKYKDENFRNYDQYLTISAYTDQWLKKYWPEMQKQQNVLLYPPVLPERSGIYSEEFAETSDERISTEEYLKNKKKIILCVGRFIKNGHNKKQLEMVRAFLDAKDCLKDFTFHIIGSVSKRPEDLEYLKAVREQAADEPRIVFHENCEPEELDALYHDAGYFWHAAGYQEDSLAEPEKMEHFGITTVEAMYHGLVPIVVNRGGQTEIVEDGCGFLWETLDDCVNYTAMLGNDAELRIRMAENAMKRAEDFSVESFVKRCREIFVG